MIAMGQDKSKESRIKELEDKLSLVDSFNPKMKWTEDRINIIEDQVRQLAENTEVDLIERLKPIQRQIKSILNMQTATAASGGIFASPG